jgi:hypothetical protein
MVATWPTVRTEFEALGITWPWAGRVPWHTTGLSPWRAVFYLENRPSPFLANRFYEGLSYGLHPVFGGECRDTIAWSGYPVPKALVIDSAEEIPAAVAYDATTYLRAWREQATAEQRQVLGDMATIIQGGCV